MSTPFADLMLFNDPVPLPDGTAWTAHMVDWDPYRECHVTLSVTIHLPGGARDTFERSFSEPSDADARSDMANAIDLAVRHRRGLLR